MENTRPIGLVVAMDAELVHTLRAFPPVRMERRGALDFQELAIGSHRVIAVRSGMGLINAAAATERLLAEYAPRLVLNYGCSGAHRREIMPGDIVLGQRVVHHSAMQILKDGSERHSGFGYEVSGERMDAAELETDAVLAAAANRVAAHFTPEPWPDELFWPRGVPRREPVIHRGTVASADIWTQAVERLDILHARHRSLCEDMEAAAIAQVCALHDIPFFTVKDISNNEYLQASDLEGFTDFPIDEIGKRAGAFTCRLIEELPA
ncbi:MAG: 5'-methylthioadenosine/S-adenosylhomocysteine nucleosidase [Thermomicrobiales bacterium]|nr:5'-methylthioadenosine/S-adenosylhomocysteine nucleosidase [Thermomicrobiales bacterium]